MSQPHAQHDTAPDPADAPKIAAAHVAATGDVFGMLSQFIGDVPWSEFVEASAEVVKAIDSDA